MCQRVFFLLFLSSSLAVAQQTPAKPAAGGILPQSPAQASKSQTQDDSKSQTPLAPSAAAGKAADYSQQAFVIEKYLTKIRFENDGTSER